MNVIVVNRSSIKTVEIRFAVRAIASQVRTDLAPLWGLAEPRIVLAESFPDDPRGAVAPQGIGGRHADPVVFVVDSDESVDLGAHRATSRGTPWGIVDIGESRLDSFDTDWTVTLSHEILEIIVNPYMNRFSVGPANEDDPFPLYPVEVCDPGDGFYSGDGVEVSNFVTPAWFGGIGEGAFPVDFTGQCKGPWDITHNGFAVYFDRSMQARSMMESGASAVREERAGAKRFARVARECGRV